MKANFFRF